MLVMLNTTVKKPSGSDIVTKQGKLQMYQKVNYKYFRFTIDMNA